MPARTVPGVRTPEVAASSCPACRRDGVLSSASPHARMCSDCAVALWASAEDRYAADGYRGIGLPGALRHTPGRPDVLITAARGVTYLRGDEARPANRWTASAAEALAAASGASALTASGPPGPPHSGDGPDPDFAAGLAALAGPGVFVLDVGGMRDRQVDCCLGLGARPDPAGEAIAAGLERALTSRGIRVRVGDPFPARSPVSVTTFVQERLGGSALQVQLAAWLRDPVQSPTVAWVVLDVLRAALPG